MEPAEPLLNIVGERIALGPLRRELAPRLLGWFNDFATTRALGDIAPPWTAERLRVWFEMEDTTPDLFPFVIYARDGDDWQPIGTTALLDVDFRNGTAEFGIIIGEASARGQGYGTEVTRLMLDYAFSALGLHSVLLTVYSFQLAGQRAYTRAGFREIGRQREVHCEAGVWHDRVYMEALARDFKSQLLARVFVPDEAR
jgi:RimJ/RimL family protein N-acetyltransferase